MTGRKCAHVDACTASQGVMGGVCPITSRDSCTWYEPEVDWERLLAIAAVMAADSVRSSKALHDISPVYVLHAARNIAEACGETFGSIRKRDLTKWGTSIVPKETIVDRDALLALADEIDRRSNDGCINPGPMRPLATSLDLFGYARRIREAVGA